VRASAIDVLAQFGPTAKDYLPQILGLRKDKNAAVRTSVMTALFRIKPESNELVPILLAGLDDDDKAVRFRSVGLLGGMEGLARQAVPKLLARVDGKDLEMRQEVVYALSRIGPGEPMVVDALLTLLREKDHPVLRTNAAAALGGVQGRKAEVATALLNAYAAEDVQDAQLKHDVRHSVLSALARIGGDAKDAAPALVKIVDNHRIERDLRARAAEALGKIGACTDSVVAALTNAAIDDDSLVSQAATDALKELKPKRR
jgi:HEAT repeat protein